MPHFGSQKRLLVAKLDSGVLMKKRSVSKKSILIALSFTVGAQMPVSAFAKNRANQGGGSQSQQQSVDDLFPVDLFNDTSSGTATADNSDTSDTGLGATFPDLNVGSGNGSGTRSGQKKAGSGSSSGSSSTTRTGQPPRMAPATVPDAYACPLFENRPHAELISAVDALTKEVRASQECSDDTNVKTLQDSGKTIKDNIATLQTIMDTQDPSQVNTAQIDQSMTTALQAVSSIGDVLNNNVFLNSKCGRQTMSTGKALLALNDVINGIAPYALFAVSMNAALAPALPFVIGGVVATSGISALSKMINANTLDMENPDHRKAVLQNTCQFTKVAKKVRFMQLAQSGKIDKITQELEKDVTLYKQNFAKPTSELYSLLKYKDTATKQITEIEKQLASDKMDLATIDGQVGTSNDDLMVCTLAQELVNWSQDGTSFPASVFNNLSAASSQNNKSQRLQAMTMKSLHQASIRRISETAPQSSESDGALKACAQAGRSWISGIRQSITATSAIIGQNKIALENELNQNMEYRSWKAQYTRIQTQQVTVKRVEKAMQELSKDNSIIDRSELAQRMVILKAGLFGANKFWSLGKSPVLAWIEHTRTMHSQSISAFLIGLKAVKSGSWSLTGTGQGKNVIFTPSGGMYTDPVKQTQDVKVMNTLANFNLDNLPLGSRENEIACQQLEGAWLDWSAAMDHLGAIQFFCDMIDPVLDVKMDASVVAACRGVGQLNGRMQSESIVNQQKNILISKGYHNEAALVSRKLKELQCPLPAVSVMNQ